MTSTMFRIGSPLITFWTSSASSVSCSTSASASWRGRGQMRARTAAQHSETDGQERAGRVCMCQHDFSREREGNVGVRTLWSSGSLDLRSAATRDSPAISRLSCHKGGVAQRVSRLVLVLA